jgi:hypothetical protein
MTADGGLHVGPRRKYGRSPRAQRQETDSRQLPVRRGAVVCATLSITRAIPFDRPSCSAHAAARRHDRAHTILPGHSPRISKHSALSTLRNLRQPHATPNTQSNRARRALARERSSLSGRRDLRANEFLVESIAASERVRALQNAISKTTSKIQNGFDTPAQDRSCGSPPFFLGFFF